MIELREVQKVFHAGEPNEFAALRGVNLSIDAQKVTVFKGPSGSGKTTLLSIVGCMARPTAGRVFLNGAEITSLPERFLTGIRRKTFGFIFQQYNLIRGLTALENVMLPVYPAGERHAELSDRALRLLDIFNLRDKAMAKVEWLSGGEAQRVATARALANDPSVIIADEPTAHLDTRLSADFLETVARLRDGGRTILIASHDPIVCDAPIVDRVVEMRDGRVEAILDRP